MTDIVPAKDIDYGNVDEICGYRLLLTKIYECEGGLDIPAANTPQTREISRQALVWVREVKSIIESVITTSPQQSRSGSVQGQRPCSLSALPSLLAGYDMLHRIAHGYPCHDYLREVKLRTADRWIKGDRSISRTDVVLLLLSETDRDIRTLEKRYSEYSIKVMSSWVDELMKNGVFKDTTFSETYRRLSYLLKTDLFVYTTNQAKVKSQWVSTHTLPEEQIRELATDKLWDYVHFIGSLPFSNHTQYERNNAMYNHILSEIALRPDTHPFAAKAIQLTLARYESLSA